MCGVSLWALRTRVSHREERLGTPPSPLPCLASLELLGSLLPTSERIPGGADTLVGLNSAVMTQFQGHLCHLRGISS